MKILTLLFLAFIGLTSYFLLFDSFRFQPFLFAQNSSPILDSTNPIIGINYYVSPNGNDNNNGLSRDMPLRTIQKAIDQAEPGTRINLEPGIYLEDIITKRDGAKDAPIIISGVKEAIIKGGGSDRVFEINHDYIILEGFTIDGLYGVGTESSDYRDKLIYVQGKEIKAGVTGLKITDMSIKNGGGECIRLRYFAQNNEIVNNIIENCGVHDFKFKTKGKNGEGIYIGTAPEQRKDGKNPTADPDESNNNWVHRNTINTGGNECVDIKEGSSGNIIEDNKCSGQQDSESAGLDTRGSGNTFRKNEVIGSIGAGIRAGGDGVLDGINNNIYDNTLTDNKEGAIKFQRFPQSKVCGNSIAGSKESGGSFGKLFKPSEPCDKLASFYF